MWSKGEFAAALSMEGQVRQEKALESLTRMTDELGPNLWVDLDEVAVGRYFGNGEAGLDAARVFAKENGCAMVVKGGAVRLGRAYYKR